MQPVTRILGDALLQSAVILAVIGGVLGIVFGLLLLLDPARVFRMNERLARAVSPQPLLQPLDAPRSMGLDVYRHSRLIGLALLACAAYALYVLLFRYHTGSIIYAFRGVARPVVLHWIVQVSYVLLLVANGVLIVAGVLLLVRPGLLRSLEAWGARRLAPPQAVIGRLDAPHLEGERFVQRRPRLVGWLLLIGGLYVLVRLALAFVR